MNKYFQISFLCGILTLAASCASLNIQYPPDSEIYVDSPVRLSELNVYVKPDAPHPEPLTGVVIPFRVLQPTDHPEFLGKQFAKLFWQNWTKNRVFPTLAYDELLYYRGQQQAAAIARGLGVDLAIVGTVPYFLTGGTRADNSITMHVKIIDARTGELLVSMEQAGQMDAQFDSDYILYKERSRMSEAPLASIVTAIAQDMADAIVSWTPRPGEYGEENFAETTYEMIHGLTAPPPEPSVENMEEQLSAPAAPHIDLAVEFDFDKTDIRRGSFPLLNELGEALTSPQLMGKTFVVKGHTDSIGDPDYNKRLSRERAQAVKDYLVRNFDLPESVLTVEGYGDTQPLAPNNTPENRQKNRRVEISISD